MRRGAWTVVAVVWLAFGVRAFGLDRPFLWWDEGLNVYLANRPLLALFDEMQATHYTDPPVYNLALSGWRTLAGSSPYAVRFFSVLTGIVTVALTWIVGRWLTGKSALLATVLFALSPMQVHFAREAKGYAFATVCALLSVYAWGRMLGYAGDRPHPGNRARWWLVYVLSTLAAMGTHYYLGLLVAWQGLWTAGGAVLALRSPARSVALKRLGQWCAATAATLLPLALWAGATFDSVVRGVKGVSVAEPLTLFEYLGRMLSAFGAGAGAEGAIALGGGCAMVLLIGSGMLARHKPVFLLAWFAVPLLAAYLVQSAYSFFYPRFLLYLGPPCYLLAGLGITTLGRRSWTLAGVAVFILISLSLPGLVRAYAGPPLAPVTGDEDPRPLVAHLRAASQTGDGLAYSYVWQVGYVLSYAPEMRLPFYRAHYTPQNVGPELEAILAVHPRLWLLSYRIAAENPANLPGSWLENKAYRVGNNWYGPHHLALYLAPDWQTPGVGPDKGIAVFGGQIELHYPRVDARLQPGDVLALPLRWRALTTIREEHYVFVHLGLAGVPPLAQNDGPPQALTDTWDAGQKIFDRRALVLPDNLPPGCYQVFVGLYRPSDGSRLPVDGAGTDILPIGNVQVAP